MNKKVLYVTIAIVILVLGVGGLLLVKGMKSGSDATPVALQETLIPSPTEVPGTTNTASQGVSQTFTVEGGDFFFKPNEIKVKKGDTVKIIFSNSNGMHDFVVDEFNVRSKVIADGQTDTVEFVADKAGTFEYYCSVGQHRRLGMKGTLTVE